MAQSTTRLGKVGVASFCGAVVGLVVTGVHLATIPHDHAIVLHCLVGDFVAMLTAIIACLAIQLKQEEVHYQTSLERAAIVAELNHHIRNAVFLLGLAVHKSGDEDAIRIAQEATERINIALKDATADALSGRAEYRPLGSSLPSA